MHASRGAPYKVMPSIGKNDVVRNDFGPFKGAHARTSNTSPLATAALTSAGLILNGSREERSTEMMSALRMLQAAANALSERGSTASTSYEAAALLARAAMAASGSSTAMVRRDSCESFAGGGRLSAALRVLQGLRSRLAGSVERSLGAKRVLREECERVVGGCGRADARFAERRAHARGPPHDPSGRDARELSDSRSLGPLLKYYASIAQAVVQKRAFELRVGLEGRVACAEVVKRALARAVQLFDAAGHARVVDESVWRRAKPQSASEVPCADALCAAWVVARARADGRAGRPPPPSRARAPLPAHRPTSSTRVDEPRGGAFRVTSWLRLSSRLRFSSWLRVGSLPIAKGAFFLCRQRLDLRKWRCPCAPTKNRSAPYPSPRPIHLPQHFPWLGNGTEWNQLPEGRQKRESNKQPCG